MKQEIFLEVVKNSGELGLKFFKLKIIINNALRLLLLLYYIRMGMTTYQ